jgi:hypothetical protein
MVNLHRAVHVLRQKGASVSAHEDAAHLQNVEVLPNGHGRNLKTLRQIPYIELFDPLDKAGDFELPGV